MKITKPDFSDVLEGAAHIIADGVCLRAGNPFLHDPDAENVIIVDAYPEPAMPNCYEVMRVPATDAPDAKTLEAALHERYASVSVEWDDERRWS